MKLKAIISNGELIWENPMISTAELSKLEGLEVNVDIKKVIKSRSDLMNRALHLYYTHLANMLNSAGKDMRHTIHHSVDIPWTPTSVKEYIWRPVQIAMYGKESTTEATDNEMCKIYDAIDRTISERTGVHCPWPNIDEIHLNKQ